MPAYNEALRLPAMLSEAFEYLQTAYLSDDYEILLVDDGSDDDTAQIALDLAKQFKEKGGEAIRVIRLLKNRGKGGAVRHGMLHARGRRILFVDADGATTFSDLKLLEEQMDDLCAFLAHDNDKKDTMTDLGVDPSPNGTSPKLPDTPKAIVLGSRAHMVTSEAVVKRSVLRNLLMRSFHLYLSLLGISHIKDTQCGFKLFTRSAAVSIFPNLHVEGWIFDIEILIIAGLLGDVQIREVPIRWKEIQGSKMDLVKDSLGMALDLLIIRGSYALGRWKVVK